MSLDTKDGSQSRLFLIKDDGAIFISMASVDRIPVDPPIRQILFSKSVSFGDCSSILISHESKLFVSINYLNRLLATCNHARGIGFRLVLAVETSATENRDQKVILKLEDLQGKDVSLRGPQSVQNRPQDIVEQERRADSLEHGQLANQAAQEQDVRAAEDDKLLQQPQRQDDLDLQGTDSRTMKTSGRDGILPGQDHSSPQKTWIQHHDRPSRTELDESNALPDTISSNAGPRPTVPTGPLWAETHDQFRARPTVGDGEWRGFRYAIEKERYDKQGRP